MYQFEYHKPTSLAEALGLLAEDADAKLLAGGQTLIPTLRQRLVSPSALIDLAGVPELTGIVSRGDAEHQAGTASRLLRRGLSARS